MIEQTKSPYGGRIRVDGAENVGVQFNACNLRLFFWRVFAMLNVVTCIHTLIASNNMLRINKYFKSPYKLFAILNQTFHEIFLYDKWMTYISKRPIVSLLIGL